MKTKQEQMKNQVSILVILFLAPLPPPPFQISTWELHKEI